LSAVWGCTPGKASGHKSKIKLVEDGGCFEDELSVKPGIRTMPSHYFGEYNVITAVYGFQQWPGITIIAIMTIIIRSREHGA
jgi:hypothetical protein